MLYYFVLVYLLHSKSLYPYISKLNLRRLFSWLSTKGDHTHMLLYVCKDFKVEVRVVGREDTERKEKRNGIVIEPNQYQLKELSDIIL